MGTVTVVAIQEFDHEGRTIHYGEAVTLKPAQALAFARQRLISLDRSRRPTYQTRDMVAQPVTGSVPVDEHTTSDPPKRRRGRPRKSRA